MSLNVTRPALVGAAVFGTAILTVSSAFVLRAVSDESTVPEAGATGPGVVASSSAAADPSASAVPTVIPQESSAPAPPPATTGAAPKIPGGGNPASIATISSGWTIPWGMSWLPDGSAVITERDSFKVYKLSRSGQRTEVGKVPNATTTGSEGGLMGVAVSPNYASDKLVYFFHTASGDNRIAKMRLDGNALSGYATVFTGIKRAAIHNGGRLAFGPDGYLYASTGDASNGDLAQDRNSLNGKILRMTTDGKPAPGNPFGSVVYSMGHRNPQGLAWDSAGRLWTAEFGNNRVDELNMIEPGKNYGWPICEGNCSESGMTNPKKTWPTSQASPSALAIVNDVVYVAALRGERLWRVPLNGTEAGEPKAFYTNQYGRLRTVMAVPGSNQLWLSSTNCDGNGNKPDGSDKVFKIDIK